MSEWVLTLFVLLSGDRYALHIGAWDTEKDCLARQAQLLRENPYAVEGYCQRYPRYEPPGAKPGNDKKVEDRQR